jgi:hypothetical protein
MLIALALALAERLDSPLLLDRMRVVRQKLAAGLGRDPAAFLAQGEAAAGKP